MLILFFVVLTTSKPAAVSAPVTSSRVFSSPDEANISKPRVIVSAASCFVSGSPEGVTSARRFSGSFGSCSPSLPLTTVPRIDARPVGTIVIRLEAFPRQ